MHRISELSANTFALRKDPLYMNSIFMMASTLIVSVSGFLFWIISARFYDEAQIGLATALISVLLFLMNLSIVGLNYSIIRFLPKSENKNGLLSGSFIIIAVMSAICAIIFLTFLQTFSPKLAFVRENIWTTAAFFLFTIAVSIDFLMESIFLSLRAAKYIFIKNVLVSLLKIVLPVLFVGLGTIGIFASWALALSSAILVSFYVLIKKFDFISTLKFKISEFKQMISFSFINYLVGLLGIAPGLILPVFITNYMSPETTAYFYIAMMIAQLLYTIPYATTQSLFAEGSIDSQNFSKSIIKAFKLIGVIMIPAILILVLFGNLVLLIFGKNYSTEGISFLRILAVAGIPVAINYVGLTVLNIRHKIKALLIINILGTAAILILSFYLKSYSLIGVGLAWLIGHIIKNVLYAGYIATDILGVRRAK